MTRGHDRSLLDGIRPHDIDVGKSVAYILFICDADRVAESTLLHGKYFDIDYCAKDNGCVFGKHVKS
jgi:hypothetical protein